MAARRPTGSPPCCISRSAAATCCAERAGRRAGAGRAQGGRLKKPARGSMPKFARAKKNRAARASRKNHSPASTSIQTGTPPGYPWYLVHFEIQNTRRGGGLPSIFKFQTPSARPWQLACPKGRTHRPFMPHHQTTHHPPTNLLRRTKAQSNLDQLDDLRKMCDTINDELGRLATSLNHRHGAPQQRWRPWST